MFSLQEALSLVLTQLELGCKKRRELWAGPAWGLGVGVNSVSSLVLTWTNHLTSLQASTLPSAVGERIKWGDP